MALDRIQQAVCEAAEAEAKHIVQKADKAAAERVAAEVESARQEAEREYQAATRRIEEDLARQVTQFKGTAAKQLLEQRNARLREVFEGARDQILKWPAQDYAEVMRRLLERASADAGGRVRVHPEDRAAMSGVIERLNGSRAAEGRLVLDDEAPLPRRGGFVFVSSDYDVDQTLDTILSDIEHEMLPEIAGALFPG